MNVIKIIENKCLRYKQIKIYFIWVELIRSNYFFEVNNVNLIIVIIMLCFRDMQEEMNDIGKIQVC